MLILDTNTCIAVLNGNAKVEGRLKEHADQLAVPSVVAAELYMGAKASSRSAQNLMKLELFLSGVQVLDFDLDSARVFGDIQAHLRTVGRPTGVVDAMIAAVVLASGATLITHNTKDFENIPRLRVEDWLA